MAYSVEGACVGHVGACGSGKTYRLKLRVAAAARSGWPGSFVVCDVKREWPAKDGDPRGPLLSGSHISIGRCRLPPADPSGGPQVLIARPSQAADAAEIRDWADTVCRRVLERGDTVLVLPEAYRYAREHERMVPALEELAHEHRHRRCGVWLDFQSFPEVSKELLRRCGFLFIHGTGAHEDIRRLERMGGPMLASAVIEAQRLNLAKGAGHHVVFRAAQPFPPYVVRDPSGRPVRSYGEASQAR